jgi:hypothetical protein
MKPLFLKAEDGSYLSLYLVRSLYISQVTSNPNAWSIHAAFSNSLLPTRVGSYRTREDAQEAMDFLVAGWALTSDWHPAGRE